MDAKYTHALLYVIFVASSCNGSESMTACCCTGETANCSSSGLNVSCPSKDVVAFTKLFGYPLSKAEPCPRYANESAAIPRSPVETGQLVQYTLTAFSGKPNPEDTVSLPPCIDTDRSVLVYDYTCIDPSILAALCSDDVKNVSSRTLGIWSNNFGDSPSDLSMNNGACKCNIRSTSQQIKITSYNNGLGDSQFAKISESNGYVLRLWDGTFFYGDIGKTTVHNLTSGNLTFEWINPQKQHGSIWVVLTATPADGTLQIYCEDPLLKGNISTNTTAQAGWQQGLAWYAILLIIILVICVIGGVGTFFAWYTERWCCNNL